MCVYEYCLGLLNNLPAMRQSMSPPCLIWTRLKRLSHSQVLYHRPLKIVSDILLADCAMSHQINHELRQINGTVQVAISDLLCDR